MPKVFVPTTCAQDWQKLLADPGKHWRTGFSARTLAHAWEAAGGRFPPEIELLFAKAEHPGVRDLEMMLAFPEWKVDLPPRGHASQNDLFVLARNRRGLVCMMVEGKVSEPFGETLKKRKSTPTPGKQQRLEYIQDKLGLEGELPQTIRYQLLHRTVSAVIEAERFGAGSAVMLVHSFSQESLWFEDFQAFLQLFRITSARKGTLYLLKELNGLSFFAGWATGDPIYLKR